MPYNFFKVIVCSLLNTVRNLLPLIIRINRTAYLKLILFMFCKHCPGVKTVPLICSRASSNWKAALVWTGGIRAKNTQWGKSFLKLEYFTINGLVKLLKFGSLNPDSYNKHSSLALLDMQEHFEFLWNKIPVYLSVYSHTCIQQFCYLLLNCTIEKIQG